MQKTTHETIDTEIRRLFAELGEIYANAAEPSLLPIKYFWMDALDLVITEPKPRFNSRIRKLQRL